MQINIEHDGVADVFEIEGEIDLHNSPELRKQLTGRINQGIKYILLDFSNVKYIDSSGLATLIEGLRKLNKVKGEIKLCNLNKTIRSVFEVSRLEDVFAIYPNREDALNEFSRK